MTRTELRITAMQLEFVKKDLARSHAFAWERVGFLFCRAALGGKLLLATSYQAVADEMYLPDRFVGARFDGAAIRQARQRALETGEAIFHIHVHEGFGKPWFSRVDMDSLAEMIPSFISVAPGVPHGAIVLSDDGAAGLAWQRGGQAREIDEIRLTGFHSRILNGGGYERRAV